MTEKILIAGFGGQGIMLMGELLAYAAMMEGKQVTYMPSYGPEMRGGTANCSVIISDKQISSPIITEPTILVVMNEPSLDKMEKMVCPNGSVFMNKSIINRDVLRSDLEMHAIYCNAIAQEIMSEKIANIVMLGALIKNTGIVSMDSIVKVMNQKFTGKKAEMLPVNFKALAACSEDELLETSA